jgi:hypothetical protein
MSARFLKVIACEIAVREICLVAARSRSLVDLEFLTQGLHDTPSVGSAQIQARIDAVPEGKYDAILLGYGLCGNILRGLQARHTPLVVPRAHDCITFFLGSKERYQQMTEARTGAYYYTSGWLECLRRRGEKAAPADALFLPTRAGVGGHVEATYDHWVKKYGEERARYLLEVMDDWTRHYTHGVLINFEFLRALSLDEQVKGICAQRGWQYEEVPGDLGLLERWLEGEWNSEDFLVVPPGQKLAPSYSQGIIQAEPADGSAGTAEPANPAGSRLKT